MTGFGVGSAPLGPSRIVAEVRSLNHRFIDVRVRVASELGEQSFFVEQVCRKRLRRGRVDVSLRLEGTASAPSEIDLARAQAHYLALTDLRDRVAPGQDIPLSLLATLPGVFVAPGSTAPEQIRASIDEALGHSFAALDVMRASEGEALRAELLRLLADARQARAVIAAASDRLRDGHRVRLREKVNALLADTALSLDSGRLEAEVAILCERSDVVEELVRLQSHFDQFEELLGNAEPVGRRLDFLLQEIGREANTIGAKCQDAELASTVVKLKADVEKLREQVQNVE